MTQALKRSARAAVLSALLVLALLALAGPAPAAQAASPCWKLLITDWYDGTIDRAYPIPCYQQAVDHLPTDAQLYSSARDDILRAMGRQIEAQNQAAATAPATTEPPPPPATTTTTTATEPTTTAETPPPPPPPTTTSEAVVPPTTTSPGRPKPEGVAGALDKLNPGDADSFPLPLLILGALAIVLVAAGVAGMVWRRMDRGDPDADTGTA